MNNLPEASLKSNQSGCIHVYYLESGNHNDSQSVYNLQVKISYLYEVKQNIMIVDYQIGFAPKKYDIGILIIFCPSKKTIACQKEWVDAEANPEILSTSQHMSPLTTPSF